MVKTGDCSPFTRYNAPEEENWGQFPTKPNPAGEFPVGTVQNALTPAQSINCTETQPGLKVEVWASEESMGEISHLQHFAFDERGRLWGVEPKSYPNIIREASSTPSVTDDKFAGGLDRIVILEDTDGDRVMDNLKVFRDGLNMPRSIEVVTGGVIVTMTPYVVFFPNVNDVAGTPQILFSGMGPTGDFHTHGSINSIMQGLDNWIYGLTGTIDNCTVEGSDCSKGAVWRFKHTALGHPATVFQHWTRGWANAAGLGQMEDGQIFQSGASGTPHIAHSARQGKGAIDIRFASDNADRSMYWPITGDRFLWEGSSAKNSQGLFTSVTTSVSGLQFYTSRVFPGKYWNRFAFTCESAGKLCNQDSLVVSSNGSNTGSTWRAVRLPGPTRANLIASKDAWVAPILAKTGPDGAVWVLDWYNYLVLHNPAAPLGAGGAWQNHLREKTRNRIYRIVPEEGTLDPILNLGAATTEQLLGALGNTNMHWRLHAQRILISKGYSAEVGAALESILATDKHMDETENNPRVVHALWTLEGLGRLSDSAEFARLTPIMKGLLKHPAWGVRRNALRAMPRTLAGAEIVDEACSVNDPHGHVRLQALLAIGETAGKPTGLNAMATEFQNVDTTASSAFAASGVPSATAAPCTPTLDSASLTAIQGPALSQPRGDLRFAVLRGGFTLLPHGRLASGALSVYNLKGKVVFTSMYDAVAGRWSRPSAQGLKDPVYGYTFKGASGTLIQGRVSSVPDL